VIDLYEKISASHIDYQAIRDHYTGTDVLQDIKINLSKLSEILDRTGAAIQYNVRLREKIDVDIPMNALADTIACIEKDEDRQILDGLLSNIQNMYRVVTDLQHYFTDEYPVLNSDNKKIEHERFVSHTGLDLKLFRYNLSLDSLTFRHSVRMALACLTGFIISRSFIHGHHSYWLLITIIFVLKPAFSLTSERNTQRILGTIIGGVIGVVVLVLVHDEHILFACMFISMLITYSFQRHRYMIAMVFMTPYILILFHFMNVGLIEVAEERVLDTVVGSIIALMAGYLILPDWESGQISGYMKAMLHANYRYLCAVRDSLTGVNVPVTEYKLIRKEVYVATSNLSAAIQRMRSDPKGRQKNVKEMLKFSVLNHLLSSRIAAAKESLGNKSNQDDLQWTERSLEKLDHTIKFLEGDKKSVEKASSTKPELDDEFLSVYKTVTDIEQIAQVLAV